MSIRADWDTLIRTLSDDLRRHGAHAARHPVRHFFTDVGFRFVVLLRVCSFLKSKRALYPAYFIAARWYVGMSHRYGISISIRCRVGSGFYIGHFGGIVVHTDAVIGRNCNISQGVTIGQTNRGSRQGVPVIGDEVYLGPGAKVIGRVTVANRAAIGANAVVTRDVPEGGVAVGVPAKVISTEGSDGYIQDPAP